MQRILSAIPERVVRSSSGSRFAVSPELRGERIAYLAQFLHWLTPFSELTPDAQRVLGLLAPRDKPLDLDESMESEEA